jgi:hypothetical protein
MNSLSSDELGFATGTQVDRSGKREFKTCSPQGQMQMHWRREHRDQEGESSAVCRGRKYLKNKEFPV